MMGFTEEPLYSLPAPSSELIQKKRGNQIIIVKAYGGTKLISHQVRLYYLPEFILTT